MTAERQPTVAEIVASANEGLDDAILAALDHFDPLQCEWTGRRAADGCVLHASLHLRLLCCGTGWVLCVTHARAVEVLASGACGPRTCASCGEKTHPWLVKIAPIGGVK